MEESARERRDGDERCLLLDCTVPHGVLSDDWKAHSRRETGSAPEQQSYTETEGKTGLTGLTEHARDTEEHEGCLSAPRVRVVADSTSPDRQMCKMAHGNEQHTVYSKIHVRHTVYPESPYGAVTRVHLPRECD
ncbi:Nipped-B-like protein [Clarias magur]|uniref:Nipped-B-like protein n=1 Tax=Clarias magur TaxID=1594786 RepID=A0A8J4X3Q6_CLAMG|nr:Nipped-B-like protein [Clarias magur]